MLNSRNTIRDHTAEANLFARRAFIAFAFVVAMISVLLANMYYLQISDHENFTTRSNDNRIKVIPVAPNRGIIYDKNGVILAENRPVFNLEVVPEKTKDLKKKLSDLSELMDISIEEQQKFLKRIKRSRRFKSIILKSRLNEQQVALFSINQHQFPGFSIEARLARYYPYGDLLTHTLGYVGKINKRDLERLEETEQLINYKATRDIGKQGIERFYEQSLHGKVGFQEVEVNNRGRVIRTLNSTPPEPGDNLILTLDIELQKTAQSALEGLRGAIVVLDARDGGVLAMYSNPSYDPNMFVHGISTKDYAALINPDRPLINRVTQGSYPPASTIKPHLAILGLEEGVITETTKIFDPGYFQIPGVDHKYRDWKPYGHGLVDVYKAIAESCDTFYYDMAYRMGITKIHRFMTQFGFGDLSGIDIREEVSANMPSKEWKRGRHNQPWYPGDSVNVGIGQGYWTTTPIQLANSVNILANKGRHFPPHLVEAIKLKDEIKIREIDEKPPIVLRNQRHWDIALKGMHQTVHSPTGSGHKAFKGHTYNSAGKTGTAQLKTIAQDETYDENKIDERHRDNAMYVGYAPYDNPQIVITVAVENTGSGGSKAAPIARKVMDQYFKTENADKQDATRLQN